MYYIQGVPKKIKKKEHKKLKARTNFKCCNKTNSSQFTYFVRYIMEISFKNKTIKNKQLRGLKL